jgi:hypothetical protein
LVRTKVFKFEIVKTFRVPTLAAVAKRLVLEREFGAYKLLVRTKVFKFEIVKTFRDPMLAVGT